jgi:hypothetical protein
MKSLSDRCDELEAAIDANRKAFYAELDSLPYPMQHSEETARLEAEHCRASRQAGTGR